MVCDGYTVHLEATKIELEPGHLIPQSHDMRCEVIRESGDLSGEYRVFVNGSDDRINYQVNSELSWSQPTADEGFSAMQIGTVSGLALFAIIGLILFLKRDDIDEENMYEEDYPEEDNTPVHGPPATAFTGPPQQPQFKKTRWPNIKGS